MEAEWLTGIPGCLGLDHFVTDFTFSCVNQRKFKQSRIHRFMKIGQIFQNYSNTLKGGLKE